jgi:hypothetical protein
MIHAPNMMVTEALRNAAQPGMFGALSGAIAAATAADADVCVFVNKATRAVAIPSLIVSAMSGTNFTNAAAVGVKLFKATGMALDTGGTSVLAQLRKTTGYDAIPATEMEGMVSTTGAMTPGARTLASQPFHVATFGGAQSFAGESLWEPQDGLPLSLEANEGIVAQLIAATPAGGTVFLHVGFPLFRF